MKTKKLTRKAKEALSALADVPQSFESPESGSVARATYDAVTETLRVWLKRGKDTTVEYRYDGFPLNLWVEFYQATSKGQCFAHRIRPLFVGKPVV